MLVLPAQRQPKPDTSDPTDHRLDQRLQWISAHLVVALIALVAIGGATRVMEAGLACPDWPLCYGSLLPGRQMNLQVFLEWFHRLDAFLIGLGLLVLSGWSLRERQRLPGWYPWACAALLLLVAGQGLLGALTVTRLLASGIVTAHLGMALLLVAGASALHQGLHRQAAAPLSSASTRTPAAWQRLTLLLNGAALPLVFAQCLLGAAMASRWAARQCLTAADGCQWLLLHRLMAYPAAVLVLAAALVPLVRPGSSTPTRLQGLLLAVLVAAQVALGIATLRLQLAVPLVTVAHQIIAALLVALLAALFVRAFPTPEVRHG
ncbi:MAG: COX15/CtaA family protein [Cyanobacteriota bacterium]